MDAAGWRFNSEDFICKILRDVLFISSLDNGLFLLDQEFDDFLLQVLVLSVGRILERKSNIHKWHASNK